MHSFGYVLAVSTDYLIIIQLVLLALAFGTRRLTPIGLLHILASGAAAWLVGLVIKDLFYFPRPFIVAGFTPSVGYLLDGSFPSNHTAVSVGFSASASIWYKPLGFLMYLLSLSVGMGRVFAGVHSIPDIIGGAVLGIAASYLLRKLVRTNSRG